MLGNSLNLYGTISLPVKWKWWLSHRVVRIALKEIIYAEHAVYSRHIIATSLVVKWKLLSRVWFCASPWTIVHGILQARILEWVAVPFSRGSSQPRDWTQVPFIQADYVPSEPQGKPHGSCSYLVIVYFQFLLLVPDSMAFVHSTYR